MDLLDPKDHIHGVADLAFHPAALLDHLGIERAHVLGTSLGGFVAQELALQRPTLIDGLVLVCTSYGGPDSAPPSWKALRAMLGLGATNRVDAARRGLETATSEAYRTGHPEEYEQLLEWRITDAPSQPSYLEQMMAGARFDVSSRVRDIRASTLVLHGDDDRVVPVAKPKPSPKQFRVSNYASSRTLGTWSSSSKPKRSTKRSSLSLNPGGCEGCGNPKRYWRSEKRSGSSGERKRPIERSSSFSNLAGHEDGEGRTGHRQSRR